jgi:protein subunit release factor B
MLNSRQFEPPVLVGKTSTRSRPLFSCVSQLGHHLCQAKLKEKLLMVRDTRISNEGVIVIKAQRFRSQEKNKEDALKRLNKLVELASYQAPPRIATKPRKGVQEKRLRGKKQNGVRKLLRGVVKYD